MSFRGHRPFRPQTGTLILILAILFRNQRLHIDFDIPFHHNEWRQLDSEQKVVIPMLRY